MQKNYVEVRIETEIDSGEILAMLQGPAPEGAWEADGIVHLFWPEETWDSGLVGEVFSAMERLGSSLNPDGVAVTSVPDQDWNRSWSRSLSPLRIGKRVLIRQSWNSAEVPPGGIELVIDPKRAFGTGYHSTTQLLAEWLEEAVKGGEQVLDVGTGSGILAMIALRLGAVTALAIDNDPVAIECAREYAVSNGFGPELDLRISTVEDLQAGTFGMVLANIDAKTLITAIPSLAERVGPGGVLLLSGLQPQDSQDITAVITGAGGRVAETRQRDEWMALLATFGE
jgi:ribosomal protein L11 methyltransferase